MMIRWMIGIVFLLTVSLQAAEPRVMIVSIDGLRPDCALRAEMPNFRSLVKVGSFSFWATTSSVAITLPSHICMLTGVIVEKHGIVGNEDKDANDTILVPTIFDLTHQSGISSGMSAGKVKFGIFKSVDYPWVTTKSVTLDSEVADHAIEIIKEHQPRLMFIHFPGADSAGHSKGWGSREQISAIEEIDKQLGRVLAALDDAKLRDQTVIIVSADHGGRGRVHGPPNASDPTNQSIPWIISGPGIRKGVDLTLTTSNKIQTYDTFATACKVLGIKIPDGIDGKVVESAFEGELMNPTTKPVSSKPWDLDRDGQNVSFATGHGVPTTQPVQGAQIENIYSASDANFSPATAPTTQSSNCADHGDGQNVLFADGHVDWATTVWTGTTQPTTQPQTEIPTSQITK